MAYNLGKPATVPPPWLVDLEEEFMILEDEATMPFVIPRKTDVRKNKKTVQAKTSKESLPAEPLSQDEDVNDQQRMTSKRSKAQTESAKKQPKGNGGKASQKKGKDAVVDVLEQTMSEEEVGATSEVFCAHRQHDPTPGEKQLFAHGSAKKPPSFSQKSKATNTTRNVQRNISTDRGQRCRNILDPLEHQSDHSSENMAHRDDQMLRNRHVSSRFVAVKPSGYKTRSSVRVSCGPTTLSDVDDAFRSGPSSMTELQHHDEEDYDIVWPSTRLTFCVQHVPRVLSRCDICGPPLQTIVLEEDDWNNVKAWFSHLWPPVSKEGGVISPDDFHWHSYGGEVMGHVVDLQSATFSHGKIVLGSFMKKPPQMDLETVYVFNIISSCVRVEVNDVKSVYNSGQVFMIPSGRVYSIHNLCQEPAVLIYHRTIRQMCI